MRPDRNYVFSLLEYLKRQYEGLHRKMNEIENLRYFEDTLAMARSDKPTGLEVRIGTTSELIENVKAALTTNLPKVEIVPHRRGSVAQENADKRARFWNAYFQRLNRYVPVLNEFADAQVGLGMGVLKAIYAPWPKEARRRRRNESDDEYLERMEANKRAWGPPFKVITSHPLTIYAHGYGEEYMEVLEHGWKPRRYLAGLHGDEAAKAMAPGLPGLPDPVIKPLPYGVSTESMALVTEYWSRDWYQLYIDGNLVSEEPEPPVRYFIAFGRTSSSKDPDKLGISVAEVMRHIEPVLNRTLTRMAEAADLLVRKRLTVELPEGAVPELELDAENNPVPRTFKMEADKATSLPPGARVVDPFAGAEHVYAALPFLQVMMQVASQHGVAPIFKGIPPGAQGSGYRDTSLYMMARAQFQYIVNSYSAALSDLVEWLEQQLVHTVKQDILVGDLRLSPNDVDGWPSEIRVTVDPSLPHNIIPQGHFYDYMHRSGHITRRRVLKEGMGVESPDAEIYERMEEDMQEALKPFLYRDVIETVMGGLPTQDALQGVPFVGPDGPTGGRTVAGAASGGVPRQQPEGIFPPELAAIYGSGPQ